MKYAPSCPLLKAVESQLLKCCVIPRLMLVGWHEWWQMHTSLCSAEAVTNFGWTVCCVCPTVLTLYHQIITFLVLWKTLWQWQALQNAMLLFVTQEGKQVLLGMNTCCASQHGRRLLTNVDNSASSNIIVKVCVMVTCPTCIQHALKSMRHWVLYTLVRASWIKFNNCPTRCDLFSLLYFCRQLYVFQVLTPIIRSSYNCNYSFWYWLTGSTTIRSHWVGTDSCISYGRYLVVDPVNQYQKL